MSAENLRILSLLPGATEMVHALGAADQLVGRSHECDFPPEITSLPSCTEAKYEIAFASGETNRRIQSLIREGLSVFRVNEQKLVQLQPDVIITQDHCEACAVPYNDVYEAVQTRLGKQVNLVDYSPSQLSDLYGALDEVAYSIGKKQIAERIKREMKASFRALDQQTKNQQKPEVVVLEWFDPLMTSGNWLPELINIAGGVCRLGNPGHHAEIIDIRKLVEVDPAIIILAPCGYDLDEVNRHLPELTECPGWNDLAAVQSGKVYSVDANHYFNRPGPRLVDSARIAAEIIHPDLFDPTYKNSGWEMVGEEV